jgi:hypothetical protein
MTRRHNSVSDTNFYLFDIIDPGSGENSVSDTEFRGRE